MSKREPINIVLRRRFEDQHQANVKALQENNKLSSIADFTSRSDGKVKGALMKRKIAEQNARIRELLDERRRKLALLLNAERTQYEKDIEDSFETPEQVKERMFAYARQLKAENDAEKRKLREELENKRFIAGSDVLRARASEIIAERTALDRLAQLQEKQRLKAAEEARERAFEEERAKAAATMFSKAEVHAEAKRRLAEEMRKALNAQVSVKQALTHTEKSYQQHVDEIILEEDRKAAEALRNADIARRQRERDEYYRVLEFNASEAAVKHAALSAEAEADRKELEAAMRKEAEDIAREKAAVEAAKRETMEFRRALAEQMQKQAEQTGWMDAFYAEEQEKEWAKRQVTWDADAEARKSLMREVAATRLAQMQEKVAIKAHLKEHDKDQIAIWRAQQDAEDAKERAKQEERKAATSKAAEYTRQQLEDKRRRDEAEKQAEYLSWRLQQKEEKEYAARVQALLKDPATFRKF